MGCWPRAATRRPGWIGRCSGSATARRSCSAPCLSLSTRPRPGRTQPRRSEPRSMDCPLSQQPSASVLFLLVVPPDMIRSEALTRTSPEVCSPILPHRSGRLTRAVSRSACWSCGTPPRRGSCLSARGSGAATSTSFSFEHFSALFAPHTPCDVLYVVPVLIRIRCHAIRCYARFTSSGGLRSGLRRRC